MALNAKTNAISVGLFGKKFILWSTLILIDILDKFRNLLHSFRVQSGSDLYSTQEVSFQITSRIISAN